MFLSRTNEPQNDIVIIEIDNESIKNLGSWPIKRKYYSQMLDIIFKDKAKVAAFYLVFSDYLNKDEDNFFIETLSKYPSVILKPQIVIDSNDEGNFWAKISKTSFIGHNIFSLDNNFIIRKQFAFVGNDPSFALSILKIVDNNNYLKYLSEVNKHGVLLSINFKRLYNLFPRYSLIDVLENKLPSDTFKDKIVLIGITSVVKAEHYVTPLSRNQKAYFAGNTNAVTVQAQILDSMLNFKILREVHFKYLYVIALFLIFILLNFLNKIGIIRQIVLTFLFLPSVFLLISLVVLNLFTLWASPLILILSSILCFLMVSVSVIFDTTRFLDKYILELSGNVKKDILLSKDSSVDGKLASLKGLTEFVNKDKNLLETVLMSVNSIIMLFDNKGKIIYSNNPLFSQVDFNINEISDQIDLEEIKDICTKNETYKTRIKLKTSHYNFLVSLTRGNLFVGVLNDISDMVKMNEMKTDLLRMLSHEFKTPLATTLLCSDYLKELNKDEALDNYIDRISNVTIFLEEMIDDFLAISKLEVSDFKIEKEPVDPLIFIQSVISNLSVLAETKNIRINLDLEKYVPSKMLVDSKYFFIAIKNILDNAIKYSPEEKEIFIKIEINDNNLVYSFKDQGFGISKENLARLFEKFYRVSTEKTLGIKGTGLGLSFVKRVIDLHGGKIVVNSVENEGSEFIVSMPIEKQ